jgi:hypothetical protein
LVKIDAREIAENVGGFFSVLNYWSRVESATPANAYRRLA